MRRILPYGLLILATAASNGCSSLPRWDWWRTARADATDSTPIARSASTTALPSEIAQQGGGQAPPFQPGAPQVYPSTSGQTGPSGATALPPGGYPTTPFPSSGASGVVPSGHMGQSPASPQLGPYAPGAQSPALAPPATNIPGLGAADPRTVTLNPATPPHASLPPYPSTGASAPATTLPPATSLGTATLPPRSTALPTQPFRPGGTSDYVAGGQGPGQPPVNVAVRPQSGTLPPLYPSGAPTTGSRIPTTPPTMPSLPTYPSAGSGTR